MSDMGSIADDGEYIFDEADPEYQPGNEYQDGDSADEWYTV